MKSLIATFAIALCSASLAHAQEEDWKTEVSEYIYSEPKLAGYEVEVCMEQDCLTINRALTTMGEFSGTSFLGSAGLDSSIYDLIEAPPTKEPEPAKTGGLGKWIKDVVRGIVDGGGIKKDTEIELAAKEEETKPDGTKTTREVKVKIKSGISVTIPPSP